MRRTEPLPPIRDLVRPIAVTAMIALGATACSAVGADATSSPSGQSSAGGDAVEASDAVEVGLWDSSAVHDIDIEFDQAAYDAMIDTFETTAEKDWIAVTATIDGATYEDAGLRLKGNSSLRTVSTETAQNPEDLHWLIRLDKFVDGQEHQGYDDIVIRSNSTETSMNEAIAVELLAEAGLATQEAVATELTFNGGDTELRLAMQNPEGSWEAENFAADNYTLYKAESTGDYSYRGVDWDAYDEVFDVESGDDDLDPLIDFLEFINNADDATFAAELGDHLDVDSFATYLAFQNVVDNFDDIDGPGNNSYLHYDYDTQTFTVVNWDLNLAFGTANSAGGGGFGGPGARGERPARPDAAEGLAERPGGAGGPGRGGNVLSERFLAIDDFAQMYDDAVAELTETLFADGTADDIIAEWVEVLATQDIVDTATIESDAAAIRRAYPVT